MACVTIENLAGPEPVLTSVMLTTHHDAHQARKGWGLPCKQLTVCCQAKHSLHKLQISKHCPAALF